MLKVIHETKDGFTFIGKTEGMITVSGSSPVWALTIGTMGREDAKFLSELRVQSLQDIEEVLRDIYEESSEATLFYRDLVKEINKRQVHISGVSTINRISNGFSIVGEDGSVIYVTTGTAGWLVQFSGFGNHLPLNEIEVPLLQKIQVMLRVARDPACLSSAFCRDLTAYLDSVATPKTPEQDTPAKAERRSLLSEECSEVIKSLQKINRFGEVNKYANEKEHLESECGDILAAMSLMVLSEDLDPVQIYRAAQTKLGKFRTDYSLMSKQDPALLRNSFVVFESRVQSIDYVKNIIKEEN